MCCSTWNATNVFSRSCGPGNALDSTGVNASYRSETTSAFGRNAPTSPYPFSLLMVDAYTLVDGQLGIADGGGRWRVTAFARNLLNRYYFTDAFRQIDNVARHVGEPCTYGLRVNYNF